KQKSTTNYSMSNNDNNENYTNTNQDSDNSYVPIQCNNIVSKYKRQALTPLDKNIVLSKTIFKESNNAYIEVNQDNKLLTDNQVHEEGV
ncbi:26954_t:CDS:2, partial [Dentiscutata erythropus]